MLLSDRDIHGAIDAGNLALDPFEPSLVQPASIDLRLGRGFRLMLPGDLPHDPRHLVDYTVEYDTGSWTLEPGQFVLAHTLEKVTLGPGLAAKLEGKSSLGRLGLVLHSTAGYIDPGFSGTITLELAMLAPRPLRLYEGMKVGQLAVFRMSSPALVPYGSPELGSKYQGQNVPTASAYRI